VTSLAYHQIFFIQMDPVYHPANSLYKNASTLMEVNIAIFLAKILQTLLSSMDPVLLNALTLSSPKLMDHLLISLVSVFLNALPISF